MDNEAAGPSGFKSEMVKSAGEAELKMIKDQINQVIVGVILAKWEPSIIVKYKKKKGDALGRGNCEGLKLIDHILKIVESVNKFIR